MKTYLSQSKQIINEFLDEFAEDFIIYTDTYKRHHFTPISDLYVPSLNEHLRFSRPVIQVVFSYEDQFKKESHEIGDSLFDLMSIATAPTDYDAMLIRKKREALQAQNKQNRIITASFPDGFGIDLIDKN